MSTATARPTTANYHHPEIIHTATNHLPPQQHHRRLSGPNSQFDRYSSDQKQQQQQHRYSQFSPPPTNTTTATRTTASSTGPITANTKSSVPQKPHQQPETQPTMSHRSRNENTNGNASASRRDFDRRAGGQRDRRVQRIGDFDILKTLGKGTFSKVCMAEHRITKQKFALKFIKPKSPQGGSADKHNIRVEREIKLLSLLYHPNIVRLYDVVQNPKFTMIVMEYNKGGELLHSIRKRGRLHENEARGYFRQIVSAMDYTHRNCIIHRDLKLENVMLDHDNRIRIIDYGFANTFEWDKHLDTFCGSPFYAAPEMVKGVRYTGPEVDIWSMGVILFFMLCGRTPFEGENLQEIYNKIARGRFVMPPFLSNDAQDLLCKMLTVNPQQRISMKGIVEHPWLNKDCDRLVDNHLPSRPAVVLQPNEQSLKKMSVYKYDVDSVAAALAHSDMALTPMVCIYHLVEESRRRKASRNARRSQAAHMGVNTGSNTDVGSVASSTTTPYSAAGNGQVPPPISTSGVHGEYSSRPTSRNRYSYAPGGDNSNVSPVSKMAHANAMGDAAGYKGGKQQQDGHLHAPQPQYLHNKDSEIGMHGGDSTSFGASQYGPPRLRKGSTASGGHLSVGSSLNLEASSPFLRDDDKRSSRSSRFFARVRKSMPFLKTRQSQVMDEVPPFEQSNVNVDHRNHRASFFQSPFRRFSGAPSAVSLNSPSSGGNNHNRVQSYYPPSSQPPPPPPPPPPAMHPAAAAAAAAAAAQAQAQKNTPQQHPYSGSDGRLNHPSTANVESYASGQRPSTSSSNNQHRHRYTDFGPVTANNPASPPAAPAVAGGRHRKSEPLYDLPHEDPAVNGNNRQNKNDKRRTPRPLSVMSNRQVTPLRLHPTQSHQGNSAATPFAPQRSGVALPPALTSHGSAPSGVMAGHGQQRQQPNTKPGVRGIFNLRCTMLGPLAEIHTNIEQALKTRAIVLRKMTDALYSCDDHGLRFEILVEHVQGHLYTIKFKRLEGGWWAYKKLTIAITESLQSTQRQQHHPVY